MVLPGEAVTTNTTLELFNLEMLDAVMCLEVVSAAGTCSSETLATRWALQVVVTARYY